MDQEKLNQLLTKYLAGQCTLEETRQVQQWYASLGEEPETLPVTAPEKKRLEQTLWQRIRSGLAETGHSLPEDRPASIVRRQPVHQSSWAYAVAATVLLLVVATLLFLQPPSGRENLSAGPAGKVYEAYTNRSAIAEQLLLSDGSAVWLQPQSQLQYPLTFGPRQREVILTGEAFFEIARDEKRPFQVHSGKLAVRVLGTSFNVRAYAGEDSVEVAVRTGRVSVYTGPEAKPGADPSAGLSTGTVLLPDQKATLYLATRRLVKRESPYSRPEMEPAPRRQIFSETPLPDVMRTLERAYGVEVHLENPDLTACTLTATLFDQPLAVKLEMICKSIGATFEQNGRQISIRGEGCR
jgi:transmembrane sensor